MLMRKNQTGSPATRSRSTTNTITRRLARLAGARLGTAINECIPKRESLIAGLIEQRLSRSTKRMSAQFNASLRKKESLDKTMALLTESLVHLYFENQKLMKLVREQRPNPARAAYLTPLRAYLRDRILSVVHGKTSTRRAWTLSNAIVGILEASLTDPSERITRSELTREINRILQLTTHA